MALFLAVLSLSGCNRARNPEYVTLSLFGAEYEFGCGAPGTYSVRVNETAFTGLLKDFDRDG